MEAVQVDSLPEGTGWLYEPKWDGFRCLVFRDGDSVYLQSKAQKPLARYFPDVERAMRVLRPSRFVLDGELAIPIAGHLSFEELQLRLHPAASRVATLAERHPAIFIAFDLLAGEKGEALLDLPLEERRRHLEAFGRSFLAQASGADASRPGPSLNSVRLSPASTDLKTARAWMKRTGKSLDGVMAKKLELPYGAGKRDAMLKVKRIRSADCVIGGFRWRAGSREAGSLLLGLYGEDGLLHHVGYTSSLDRVERARVTPELIRR